MANLPTPLKPGDTIAVVAPSRKVFHEQMEHSWQVFKEWDLQVIQGENLFNADGYFAGTDEERLKDFQQFLNDEDVKAIFCARGGYGASRFVDRIVWQNLITKPKWIIGFSDVTALHLGAGSFSLSTVHGLMPAQYGYKGIKKSLKSLYQLLFHHQFSHVLPSGRILQEGEITAPIVGGNLSLLAESLGTPTEIQTSGKILLLEEIDEYLYKIDRMLNQLKRAEKFEDLKGIIIGDFSDLKDTKIPFGKDVYGILETYFKELNIPVASGIPVGHESYNLAVPLQVPVHMKVQGDHCHLNLVTQV